MGLQTPLWGKGMRDVYLGGVGNFLPPFFIRIVGLAEGAANAFGVRPVAKTGTRGKTSINSSYQALE